jgi:peptide/nickel transport system permease protein
MKSHWWWRFLTRWQNWFGLMLVILFVGVAVAAPILAPQPDGSGANPYKKVQGTGFILSTIPQPPSPEHPLGTTADNLDVFHTLVWGTRYALRFGLTVTLATAFIGILIGAITAFRGGWLNGVGMRTADAFLAFPVIAGVVLLQQVLTARYLGWFLAPLSPFQERMATLDPDPILWALILFSWMPYARLINTTVTQIRSSDYIVAARAMGMGNSRIIFRHLLPNAISPAIVLGARDVGAMLVLAAAFTFIGLGGRDPWGVMLVNNRNWIAGPGGDLLAYWWVYLPITIALVLFGVAWNLLGDGINDAINPRIS